MAKMIDIKAKWAGTAINHLITEVLDLKRANEEMTKRIERLEQAVYSEEEMGNGVG